MYVCMYVCMYAVAQSCLNNYGGGIKLWRGAEGAEVMWGGGV